MLLRLEMNYCYLASYNAIFNVSHSLLHSEKRNYGNTELWRTLKWMSAVCFCVRKWITNTITFGFIWHFSQNVRSLLLVHLEMNQGNIFSSKFVFYLNSFYVGISTYQTLFENNIGRYWYDPNWSDMISKHGLTVEDGMILQWHAFLLDLSPHICGLRPQQIKLISVTLVSVFCHI